MAYVDFEGPAIKDITALHYANDAGKLPEAYRIFEHLVKESVHVSKEATSFDRLIELNEEIHRRHLEEGAALLEGLSPSILNVQCQPSDALPKIIEMNGGKTLKVGTCTDVRSVDYFFKGRGIPYKIASGSKLGVGLDGNLNGKFERYGGGFAKADSYIPEDGNVIVNSIIDGALCKKAHENKNKVYVVRDEKNPYVLGNILIDGLRKEKIPFSIL